MRHGIFGHLLLHMCLQLFDAEKVIKKSNQIIPDNFNNTPQVFGVSLDKNYDENKCNLGVECVMFAGLEFPIPFVSLLTRFFY